MMLTTPGKHIARLNGSPIVPSSWTGSTWSISNNRFMNFPTLGAEILTNGDMEAGSPPDNWSALQAVATSVTDGGSTAIDLEVDTGQTSGYVYQIKTLTQYNWYRMGGKLRNVDATNVFLRAYNNVAFDWTSQTAVVTGTSFANVLKTFRYDAEQDLVYYIWATGVATKHVRGDDVSLKNIDLASMFCTKDFGSLPPLTMTVWPYVVPGSQVGMVTCLDSKETPENFILIYLDGSTVKIDNCVEGTYGNFMSEAISYIPGAPLSASIVNGQYWPEVTVTYNGQAVGESTTILNSSSSNTNGMFSTGDGSYIKRFEMTI